MNQYLDEIKFIGCHLIQFILMPFVTFHQKEFFKFVPFPLFLSFSNEIFMLPLTFFISWSSHKFTSNFSYLRMPPQIWKLFFFATIVTTLGMFIMNISIYASDIDFILLFRLTGIIWNGLFGFLFLHERLSSLGFFSLGIVLFGIVFIMKDFEWSTSRLPSTTQIFLQLLLLITFSINLLFNKKILSIISHSETNFKMLDFLLWKSIFLLPISFVFSLFLEPGAWINFSNIFDSKMISWLLLGIIFHQILQVSMTYSEKITSMITMGVINQLRILGTLIISNFMFHQTHWEFSKLFGAGMLFCGGILYSISRMNTNKPISNTSNNSSISESDNEKLILNFETEREKSDIET